MPPPPPGGGPPPPHPPPPGPPPDHRRRAAHHHAAHAARCLTLAADSPRPRRAHRHVERSRTAPVIAADARPGRRIQIEAAEARRVVQIPSRALSRPERHNRRPLGRNAARHSCRAPVEMLYGAPLDAMMNGLTEIFHGSGRLVPTTMRCRTSPKLDGPHSCRKL